jgi:hypothetical protein
MESAVHSFLLSVPQAAAIWMVMVLVIALAAMALMLPGRAASGPAREAAADDGARYADEVAVAAERAAATARRARAQWRDAQDDVDAAWDAYDQADRAVRRAASASAFPVLDGYPGSDEYADRARNLHRAATAACRRHEINIKQLNEALAHRGWDPRLHPVAQESALLRAMREHRLAGYRAATAREHETWRAAEAAAAALGSLRAEAVAARVRVGLREPSADAQWWAEQWATTQPLPVVVAPSAVEGRHPIAA